MNIIKIINEDYIPKYYGISDLSTGIIIGRLIEKSKEIVRYFSQNFNNQIISIDDYIDCVWLKNTLMFRQASKNVIEEKKEDFDNIITFLASIEIKKKDELYFIKDNSASILCEKFEDDHLIIFHEIAEELVKTIYSHYDYFDRKTFKLIEDNYIYILLYNFDIAEKYYMKNVKLFETIFDLPTNKYLFDVRNFRNTFELLNKSSKGFVREFLELKATEVIKDVVELAKQIDEDNYIENRHFTEQILQLFNENNFRFKEQYQIDNLQEKISEASTKYFEKHGHKFESGPIDFNELKKQLETNLRSKDSFIHYLSLTHSFRDRRLKSNLMHIFSGKKSIVDMVSSTENTDDYFTQSRLVFLNFHFEIYCRLLYLIFGDESLLKIMKEHISIVLGDIDSNEANGNLELVESFEGVCKDLVEVIHFQNNPYSDIERYKCYSVSMFLITLIEKVLRRKTINLYRDELYYSDNDLSLGDLLRIKNRQGVSFNNKLTDILDEELIRVLEYKLSKTYDTNIGENIRNNLMHNRNIKYSSMSNGLTLQVFFLFISVINGIYANYLNHNNSGYKND